ncbi:glucokinase [Nitrosospira sp. Nsp2]|uniref:glucokinase n=1 Tax=Nitrosospira sp. Nsp2 TaxID=136548 RepID=UPI000D31DE89|nr:glucokinase [Nitrosospira sp. Nsp2]PTR17283.1 glucokinase [Nitrosospira sp. Nsp2]
MTANFVSGDIGGTKTLLQAAEWLAGDAQVRFERRYANREYSSFSDVLGDFLGNTSALGMKPPLSACFAVAGPVTEQGIKLTNLPWLMNARVLEREFGIPSVKLINDFEAVALSVEVLAVDDLVTLQKGLPYANGLRVTLGAGTGMGVAWLIWQGGRYIPLPTEAGHIDFAPVDELQMRLLDYLRKRFGHVSVERVLSGPGLVNIFNFLLDEWGGTENLAQARLESDEAPQVSDLAFNQGDPVAMKSIDLFVEIYGAYAGNLALAGLCRDGVYVAGGIAPRIIGKLQEGGFIKAFREKGRFSSLMEDIPVHVVMNPTAGLMGAAEEAKRMLVAGPGRE